MLLSSRGPQVSAGGGQEIRSSSTLPCSTWGLYETERSPIESHLRLGHAFRPMSLLLGIHACFLFIPLQPLLASVRPALHNSEEEREQRRRQDGNREDRDSHFSRTKLIGTPFDCSCQLWQRDTTQYCHQQPEEFCSVKPDLWLPTERTCRTI